MEIKENYSLKALNTFGIDVKARYFAVFQSVDELKALLTFQQQKGIPRLIIGGGSNILFTKDFDGIVLKNELGGIAVVSENDKNIFIKAGAGELWHNVVMQCVDKGYQGIENMALIPGCIGAAPMQNIGAYGIELKDVFYELQALNILSGEIENFDLARCEFGYRESVFKRKYRDQFVILNVTLRLNKIPVYNVSYGNLHQEIDAKYKGELSVKNIANAVIAIRQSKLPDPKFIGNAGSFFKNPEVDKEKVAQLKSMYSNLVSYPIDNQKEKLAAGWLIEQAGWKGKRIKDYGVHEKQALVLVNYGGSQGKDVYDLSTSIIDSVKEKFGLVLEREVNIY